MTEVKLSALRHSAFYTPYLLTFSRDYLTRLNIQAEYTPATSFQTMIDGLSSKTIHIAQSAVGASLISGTDNKNQIRHFAQINSCDGFFIVARKAEKFTWQDLQQRSVLIDHLFQPMAMLRYVLGKKNIDINRINVIDAGDVERMISAYKKGQGDFIHLQGPYAQQLEYEGLGTVVAAVGHELGPVAYSSLCCHEDNLGDEAVVKFYQAFQLAQQACQTDSAQSLAKDITYLFPEISLPILEQTISAYQQLGTWSGSEIELSHYNKAVEVFLASGDLKQDIPYSTFISKCN